MAAAIAIGLLPEPVGHSKMIFRYPEANADSISFRISTCTGLGVGNGKFSMYGGVVGIVIVIIIR